MSTPQCMENGMPRCTGVRFNQPASVMIGCAIALIAWTTALAQPVESACGGLDNGNNGPYDYMVERGRKLSVVEEFHFTPVVESLIRGQSSSIGEDLSYTLTVFPNHHRALMAMMLLGEKVKSRQPSGAKYTVECYFDRALRFRGTDPVARMIYAMYLAKNARTPEAVKQLEAASASAADNPFTYNNIGLVYFDLKDYDKALQYAHKALALGFTQTALRDQLQKVGKWSEPPEKVESKAVSN